MIIPEKTIEWCRIEGVKLLDMSIYDVGDPFGFWIRETDGTMLALSDDCRFNIKACFRTATVLHNNKDSLHPIQQMTIISSDFWTTIIAISQFFNDACCVTIPITGCVWIRKESNFHAKIENEFTIIIYLYFRVRESAAWKISDGNHGEGQCLLEQRW